MPIPSFFDRAIARNVRARRIVFSLTRVESLRQGSERRVLDISVEGTDAVGRFTGVLKGLTAVGQGAIVGADAKEGWARPYQE